MMAMKNILHLVIVCTFIGLLACNGKKEEKHDHAAKDVWKEMDEFHMVMAEAFHPYKDSSNLEPAKAKAPEMAAVAEKWAAAPLPAKVNTEEVKTKLAELKTGTQQFAESVPTADDAALGESLTYLHDLFHELQEIWYGGGHHHHHGHSH
jgi:hypothetical protein